MTVRLVQIPFRSKLLIIVAMALVPLAVVVAGSSLIGARQARDLADVERRLVPKLELGPRLDAEFDRLRQNMQDAVAAQDSSGLEVAAETKDRLFALIAGAGSVLTAGEAASLRWEVQEYFESARDVSRRLIAGETGEALVGDIARMQAEQAKAGGLIKRVTRLDRNELASGFASVRSASSRADQFRLAIGLTSLAIVVALSFWAGRSILRVLRDLSSGFSRFATGDFSRPIPVTLGDDLGKVAEEANQMAANLRRLGEQRDRNDWLREGQVGLSSELSGDLDLGTVTERAISFLARKLEARAGALYLSDDAGVLRLHGDYALSDPGEQAGAPSASPAPVFRPREGLVGQAVERDEILVVDDPPPDYLTVRSGLGAAAPRSIVLLPLMHLGKAIGVAELALFTPLSEAARDLLLSMRPTVVIKLEAAKSRAALQALLEQAQRQAERLAAQEEELRANNEELQNQQSDLRSANEELEAQRHALSEKNVELEEARGRVQDKADELARVSSYKSQFLANMSHELRTPLNSMLLLSHLLAENESRTLTPKQVEHCRTIHSAGEDLLSLINQVLDLAKIEAGRQDVLLESVELGSFVTHAKRVFEPLAQEKGLRLAIEVDPGLPRTVTTDHQRVDRILTNLLGNAIKFTEHGEVTLAIRRPSPGFRFERSPLPRDQVIAFAVSDTGIGIEREAQERVFAPFEQVESHSQRRYTGTGLGLAIARESAELLGGELRLDSVPGKGSTFTCFLPERPAGTGDLRDLPPAATERHVTPVQDDRDTITGDEPYLLIVEDDPILAEQLVDIIHARSFKVAVASTGQEGLRLARRQRPKGIILDVKLPDLDGWTVMERLSQDVATRAVPVHFISGVDAPERGLSLGALGYLTKPASRAELAGVVRALTLPSGTSSHRVLVVEDNAVEGESIVALLGKEALEARHVGSAAAALAAIESEKFGCVILDLGLPDMDGLGVLEALKTRSSVDAPRVVVHTGRALTKKEARQLEAYAEAVILKDGRSEERLLEEIRLFVRHLKEGLPRSGEPALVARRGTDVSLANKTILVAEDDMRTVYALSALLQGKGATVLVADTGREALELIAANHPNVDGVLMDVMMPEMDGYEAMRRLRADGRFSNLPVIALTAKAMKGEREQCLAAGASDYLTKPVDGERLLATLETWLLRPESHGS